MKVDGTCEQSKRSKGDKPILAIQLDDSSISVSIYARFISDNHCGWLKIL